MKLDIWKKYKLTSEAVELESIGELLSERELGTPVSADGLTMIPLFGSGVPEGFFAPPEDAIALDRVARYGTMIFENRDKRTAIVPLQVGYLQKGVQNHAMCTAALIPPRAKLTVTEACCVQQAQGGLMTQHDDRFIVLPHPLRAGAFAKRFEQSFSKLWNAISAFNRELGLKERGHLDELKHEHQPALVRTLHQMECVPGQTGALFLYQGRWVGLELAPDAAFWSQIHAPLVMYCYAPLELMPRFASLEDEQKLRLDAAGVTSLLELERRLAEVVERRKKRAVDHLAALGARRVASEACARVGAVGLYTLTGQGLAGQAVLYQRTGAYASIFPTSTFAV